MLAGTAEAVEELRLNEDAVDANLIGETVSADPLMTLRVLVHAAVNRPPRMLTEPETVTAAVVMMGIGAVLPRIRSAVDGGGPAAATSPTRSGPARRAAARPPPANFALGFAVHRMDHDAAVIRHAALLHDFAEMLLWCHAPDLALQIRHAQQADPAAAIQHIQRAVLNIDDDRPAAIADAARGGCPSSWCASATTGMRSIPARAA